MKKLFCGTVLAFACASVGVQAKPPIPTPRETPVIGDMDHYFLQSMYTWEEPDASLEDVVHDQEYQELIQKHSLKLLGGPMLGCVTDNSARIWVRTVESAEVQLVWDGGESDVVRTSADNDFTALLDMKGLKPNTRVAYDIRVDGEPVFAEQRPSFRTFPAKEQPATVSFAFGGGARYNPPKEKMWDVIAEHQPDALLMLGDNVYIDQPKSRTKQRVHYYRRQLRPEYQRLTASTSVYAVYDDHDLGKDDSSGGPRRFKPEWKFKTWKVFRENWNNPAYGGGDQLPGCWFDFSMGDVDVFMLDNRYYRSFEDGTMLGPEQKEWLKQRLKASTATFKVLASGTLWTEHADKGGRDSWWGVKEERNEIFDWIDEHDIGGVILISADRHRTDIYKIERPQGYDLFEFETSKLTNDHTHPTKEEALFSYNEGNFFGKMPFEFEKPDPEVTFECITMENETVHSMTLKRSQLQKN
ncbi:alkaline phosphatase family protein [Rhodopirellula sp. JC740]|uniref:Alkaline phosphatase family protein n=1 Tax=Rhodopirellula halodulae TaxID=2894198 RepID=A0ABS8NF90_9BACT|nr:alkaline phosphatase D family protein [Rhodopirellula sp. JC740]MCC9641126.1 alkaline phosphatase family protein [Rhodopirellula sp. JC740]